MGRPPAPRDGDRRAPAGALEEQAAALGHRTVLLDTNRSLDEAQAMYGSRGYVQTERYNDNPYADFWFAKELA